MSSSVQIDPTILSVTLLLAALKELGLTILELKELRERKQALEHACPVDFVFQNESGDQIGVRANAEGQVEFVGEALKADSGKATLDKVKQAYARLKVLDEVKRKGYQQVKEEKLPNGSIRLVVQKWR